MANNIEIPTQSGRPFRERVTILGIPVTLRFSWNPIAQCWVVDIYDEAGVGVWILGIPLVTGADLLDQFGHLAIGASAIYTVMTIGPDQSPDSVPTFTNLGDEGHLYVTTP